MNLETSKNLGGIGALLIVIGSIGTFAYGLVGAVGFIGLIFVLIALKGLADYYKEAGIFNNALYGFIASIIGGVAAFAVLIVSLINALVQLDITDWTQWAIQVQNDAAAGDFSALWNLIWPIVIGGIIALVVLFVFAIVSAIFYRKSLSLAGSKTGVGIFGTAGMLLLIGAILTIILIGFLIIWIGAILLIVAFFSIKTGQTQTPQTPPAPPPS